MKKTISLILALLTAASLIIPAFASGTADTVIFDRESGRSLPIIVAADAPATDRTAASKLQYYLGLCTGAEFSIVSEGDEGIFIGEAAADILDLTGAGNEGWRIKAEGNSLAIAGVGKRGTIYGAYAFLRDFCSCRWYTDKLIITPHTDRIAVAGDTDSVFNETFEYRETDWISPKDKEFSLANQLNSSIYRRFDEAEGGNVSFILGFGHTLTNEFCSGAKYFKTNPELFALHNGERTADQLCLSNEETYRIVRDEVMAALEQRCDRSNPDIYILSLTQNDNQNFCQCEKCAAADEKYGSHSGSLLLFINRIADEVKEAGYDNVVVDTFAYTYTRKPPVGIVPKDNVVVRLCSIECCFCHPLDDPGCPKNVDFMKDLHDWSKICSRLYIWDYTTNYDRTLVTFSDFGVIQKNIRIFAENGVRGIYEEGAYYAEKCNGEFADLRAYLLSRLLADPGIDLEEEMTGFMQAYYGPAAPFIREYIDILQRSQSENGHMTIYEGADKLYQSLRRKEIRHIDELWASALSAGGTDFQKANVRRSEISWIAWKAENKVSEFSRLQLPSVWMGANGDFYDRLAEEHITTFNEGPDVLMTDPAQRQYILASNPYFWKISKLDNEKVMNEYNRKYEVYSNIEKYGGFLLKPMLAVLNFIFGK